MVFTMIYQLISTYQISSPLIRQYFYHTRRNTFFLYKKYNEYHLTITKHIAITTILYGLPTSCPSQWKSVSVVNPQAIKCSDI